MRLDFNVLWVEDNQGNVESQRERIESLIRKEGFRLQTEFASTIEEAKRFLSNDIYGDHIDLILMDFDLGAGGRGDQGIVEVRDRFQYKDIIFYSSQASDLLDMVANLKVQGIFCSSRNDLTDTVVGLFEGLVKKVLDIDHSRGIVMGATSDIDHLVNDCLNTSFAKSGEIGQQKALEAVQKHVKQKRKSIGNDLDKIADVKHVSELQQYHNVYTSNDRLRLLKNVLEGNQSHPESVEAIIRYMQDTVPKRNQLAHVRVKTIGFSRKLYDQNGMELTSQQMKSLRQELLDYQVHFETLANELSSEVPMDE